EITKVYVSDKIADYILDIVWATRESKYLEAGLSTRGSLAIVSAAKTNAYFEGRDYIIPEDIKKLYPYIIPHRLVFKPEFEAQKQEIVKWIVENIPIPL
ncbi:MAG: AAA family ATPase, partial [Sulfurihydrogenibium azorense]